MGEGHLAIDLIEEDSAGSTPARHEYVSTQPGSSEPFAPMPNLDVDTLTQSDVLSRGRFAEYMLEVVQAVNADKGAVVGLTGAWGSGKSWLLTRARETLQQRIDSEGVGSKGARLPLWVSFSPWRLSGTDALLEALLARIGAELQLKQGAPLEEARKLGDALVGFAQALGTLRHIGPALALVDPALGLYVTAVGVGAKAAGDAGEEARKGLQRLQGWLRRKKSNKDGQPLGSATTRLLEARSAVDNALRDLGRRVVIEIDDLDRMSPREIADIVQMVKAVADFNGVVYVLAYDPEVVASALEHTLQVTDGHAYLEKIIQVRLRLPDAPLDIFAGEVQRAVERALQHSAWTPPDLQRHDLERAVGLAAALLVTPRDLQRLELHLKITFRLLKEQICPADLLLIEALQLKCPRLIDWIDQHRADVLVSGHLWTNAHHRARGDVGGQTVLAPLNRNGDRDPIPSAFGSNGLGGALQRQADAAMRFLLDAPRAGVDVQRAPVAAYRLRLLHNWLRWRGLVLHDEWTSNARLHALLRQPELVRSSPFWHSASKFAEFRLLAQAFVDGRADLDVGGLVRLIAQANAYFGGRIALQTALMGVTVADIGDLMQHCAPKDRFKTIEALTAADMFIDAGQALESEGDALRSHTAIPEVQQLAVQLRAAAKSAFGDLKMWADDGRSPIQLAGMLVHLGEPAATVRTLIESMLETSAEEGFEACFAKTEVPTAEALWASPPEWLPDQTFMGTRAMLAPMFASRHPELMKVWQIETNGHRKSAPLIERLPESAP